MLGKSGLESIGLLPKEFALGVGLKIKLSSEKLMLSYLFMDIKKTNIFKNLIIQDEKIRHTIF